MELHQLRYFVAVAEVGSFSRAAKMCGIAQPSLSQQIQKLETTLGTRLFDRLGRAIALTEAGDTLLPRAKRILSEVEQARESFISGASEGRMTLDVGAIPTIAPFLLPPALKRLRRESPDCSVTVREDLTERLVAALIECELDLAITSTPIEHDLIETEVIGSERLVIAAPRDMALPRQQITIADLREQPTIVLHEMHCLGRQIQDFCTRRRMAQHIVCRTTQLATALELVALGLGISIVPEMCARADRTSSRRYLPIGSGNGPTREIAVAWRRDRSRPQSALKLASFLAEPWQRRREK